MKHIADELMKGNVTSFRPSGNSMRPIIDSGNRVTLEPCKDPKIGDIVLCKVNGRYLLHKVYCATKNPSQYLIGNAKKKFNGWTGTIYGKVVEIAK